MNAKILSLQISAACTLAGLVSGLTPTRVEAAPAHMVAAAAPLDAGAVASDPATEAARSLPALG
ncbi:hypothetical protein H5407_02410 [Mitsuaria sp. WAJ17]|uniref:hypothetical protein n=1 Tax=Mitsuaria sp. WAJ17 TaxID=2761452 RepID=UPI00160155E7|nr:hypothetical protein [Mitsuaria sp. WAJ17]MBB2484070.1 hypothetical protein [Mitsuaria sp. WAJ17]